MSSETLLHLWLEEKGDALGHLPFFSSRGCTQTLNVTEGDAAKRTLEGTLVSVATDEQKFCTKIMGDDKFCPALDTNWCGNIFLVDSIVRFALPVPEKKQYEEILKLSRMAVPGSVFLQKKNEEIRVESVRNRDVSLPKEAVHGDFISYRPRLKMLLCNVMMKTHEWDMHSTWTLEMEEV